jgi:ElaB/YqjD/DUF883 family membrane-anchored ribosome-binding protein
MENQVEELPSTKTPDQIEAEMFATRESLSEKCTALENQVMGTVQTAADTITETVDAVKSFVNTAPEAVSDTVEQVASAVKEQVARTFDITGHVRSNPLSSVGVSVGLGFIAGYLIFGSQRASNSRARSATRSFAESTPPSTPREPGVLDDIFSIVGRKVKAAAETFIDAASTSVTNNIRENIPKLVEEAARRFMPDNVDTHGEPLKDGNHFYGR